MGHVHANPHPRAAAPILCAMNTTAPETGDERGGETPASLSTPVLGALWGEAKVLVRFVLSLFSVAQLRAPGISRRRGALLSMFLAHVEGGIRRIILAAALAFAPPAPRPRVCAATTSPAPAPRACVPRRAGLCIIRLAASDPASGKAPPPAKPARAKPYGHIPFPADPLLSLPHKQQHGGEARFASHRRNPLDRWVRRSRRDPDWRPPEPCEHYVPRIRPEDAPRRERHPPQANEGLPDSLWDWRRQYDAWNEPVAAPDFAARLEALQRIIADPQALIASTARRLHASREPARTRAAARPPAPRPRRTRDLASSGYGEDFALRTYALFTDTS